MPPPLAPLPYGINMFSDEQEIALGDAMAEQISRRTKMIENEQLTAHLRSLGERLVQNLPPTKLNYRFYLIDLPEVNAFSIVGGRVYVSRKVVAFVRNDDELAGILAHELGHIVTHQSAIYMTGRFRDVLGVTQLGDREDVTGKFHKYIENAARKPVRPGSAAEKGQEVADEVAVFAVARAGYSPEAFVDALDRLQETHGKIGNWLTDLIGFDTLEQHRLREAVKHVAAVPQDCIGHGRPSAESEVFAAWQKLVIEYQRGREESTTLRGLVSQGTLSPALQSEVFHLRFSPDGRYLLAQDESGIYVLSRDPLQLLFQIPTDDAYPASFSPGSDYVVSYDRYLRVDRWSIKEQKRTAVQEVTVRGGCLQTALSPDGRYIACLKRDFGLSVIEVASSTVVASKEHFFVPPFDAWFELYLVLTSAEVSNPELIHMQFSPDGRFFLAGFHSAHLAASVRHWAFDLDNHHETSLPHSIERLTSTSFTFLGRDRIAAVDASSPTKSPVLHFPSGERIAELPLTAGTHLEAVAHGDYVLVRPVQDYAVGVLDLNSKKIPAAVKQQAVDVYDGTIVHERIEGELSLDVIGSKQHLATVQLPKAHLGRISAAAVSPDLRWLALSNRSRGGIWDLSRNTQVSSVRAFRGSWYGNDQSFYVDFPKFGETPREIGRLDPVTGAGSAGYEIGEVFATQHGQYLVINTPKRKSQEPGNFAAEVEVREVKSGQSLWSRYFEHELPAISFDAESMLLAYPLSTKAGSDELQHFPELRGHSDSTDLLCEVIDVRQNRVSAKLLVKTNKGSFKAERVYLDGDWLIVSASNNQVMTYSLATGEEKGHFFGIRPLSSSAAKLLAIENQTGEVALYDHTTGQLRHRYVFGEPVSLTSFSADGKRLLVLTASQALYIFDTQGSD